MVTLLRNPESSITVTDDQQCKLDEPSRAQLTGHDNGSASDERLEVVFQPGNVEDIQVVGRLIEEENISLYRYKTRQPEQRGEEDAKTHLEQDGTGQSQLHLPSTREGSNGSLLSIGSKSNRLENLTALGFILEDTGVLEDERDNGVFCLVPVHVVLHVERAHDVRGRETFNLSVVDSSLQDKTTRMNTHKTKNERRGKGKKRTMRVDFPDPLRPQRP